MIRNPKILLLAFAVFSLGAFALLAQHFSEQGATVSGIALFAGFLMVFGISSFQLGLIHALEGVKRDAEFSRAEKGEAPPEIG